MFFEGPKGQKMMMRHGVLYEKKASKWVAKQRTVKKVVFNAKDSDDEPKSEWTKKETVPFKPCSCCPLPPKEYKLKDKADWERKTRNYINSGFMTKKYDSKKSLNELLINDPCCMDLMNNYGDMTAYE